MTKPSPDDLARAQAERVFFTWSVQRDVRPLVLDQARGARFHTPEHGWLWDLESQVYNVNIGHGHAHVQDRMIDQIRSQATAAPNMVLPIRAELGALLHRHTGMEKFFLATGGSEAVENAIKIARLVTGRSKIVARRHSYHGATLAALGVAGDPRKDPFARDLSPAYHIDDPFPCPTPQPGEPSAWVASLEALLAREDPATIAAILLEGFTGTNGMQLPPADFWPRVRALCDAHGILLIDDEIFSGFGRTGRWFAREHWGVRPDMMVLGKGLTSGYAALSAVAVSPAIARHFDDHRLVCGLTQYAHPVACAAAVGAIEVLERERLVDNADRIGAALHERLLDLQRRQPAIRTTRGLGLMRVVEFDRPIAGLHQILLQRGAYAPHRDHMLFLCPPLCLSAAEMHTVADLIEDGVRAFLRER